MRRRDIVPLWWVLCMLSLIPLIHGSVLMAHGNNYSGVPTLWFAVLILIGAMLSWWAGP